MPSPNSKQNFALMRQKILSENGKKYWRSVEEFVDAPEFEEFVKREYPNHAEDWDDSLSRRNFLKIMGASLALAGLSGCVIQPPEKIVPYVAQPEDIIPGRPLFFATAMTLGGIATGLLAESYDGRPIKIEGNPEHPGSLGRTDTFAQASLLNMYDPDRSQQVRFRGTPSTWPNFMTALRTAIDENRGDGGAGIRFLTETVSSPTLIDQFRRLAGELPSARWYQYEPVNNDGAMAGARLAFGAPVNTVYRYDLADRVLTLDKDIFGDFNVRYKYDYAKRRKLKVEGGRKLDHLYSLEEEQKKPEAFHYSWEPKEINRLYAVESTLTPTGAKADHRLAVRPSQVVEVARAIAAGVGAGGVITTYTENQEWIAGAVQDLIAHRGRSIVVPGDMQSAEVHALAHAINGALGNVGQTVYYTDPLFPFAERTQIEQLRELIADIDAGRVKMLVMLGSNPVYNTPVDLKLSPERLNKVPLRIHLGTHFDETAEHSHWHVPQKHYLEMWGDARAYDGTITLIQPLIQPLYESRSMHEVLQLFFRESFDLRDYDILRAYWQTQNLDLGATSGAARTAAAQQPGTAQAATPPATGASAAPVMTRGDQAAQGTRAGTQTARQASQIRPTAATSQQGTQTGASAQTATAPPGGQPPTTPTQAPAAASQTFEDNWRRVVHDGFIPNSALPPRTMSANTAFLAQPIQPQPARNGDLEISIRPDPSIYDGRFSNNGWLQELPKPLTKITWDNVALVSPNTARIMGLNQRNDTDEISGGERPASFITSKGQNMYADLVTLTYQGGTISKPVPVWIAPGQPDGAVTIFMGYGRTRPGRTGVGLGYDAFEVMRSDAMNYGTGGMSGTGAQATIATTQIHFNMEGRDLVRVWDINNLENELTTAEQHNVYPLTMYQSAAEHYQKQYEKYNRWAMTIDNNACIGCNACVIACQAENNIPVVGKEQVERSREMHWLRIDTYYGGTDINNPAGPYFQPVLCMQCEQAPCEPVCPVHATVHSAEGLNDMVYNRCVGTRYCSNNCPYKVRRFNFLLYQDWDTPQYKLMRNPEVTVRSRGVMEKCTYCTQRISAARIEAEKQGREILDGEVVTACQSACPTDAIVFGDLNNPSSQLAQIKRDPRNYKLLNELNTQPRTTYMPDLRNQNPAMPDYRPPAPKAQEVHKEGTASGGSEDH